MGKSTNKKYLCDSNFEMHLYCHMNLLILIGFLIYNIDAKLIEIKG